MSELNDNITIAQAEAWLQQCHKRSEEIRMNMLDGNCVECGVNILVHPKETKEPAAHYCIDCRRKTENKLTGKFVTQDLGDVEPTQVDNYIKGKYNDY